jgi:hypothetical protein
MKRQFIFPFVFLLMLAGCGGCFLYTFYEYKSYFSLPAEKERSIPLSDFLFVDPYLNIESHVGSGRNTVITAIINFRGATDTIFVKSLDVQVSCTDQPSKEFKITHILTYVDSVVPEDIKYVRAYKFDEFSEKSKMVTIEKNPWNTFQFYLETDELESVKLFNYSVSGVVQYKGKTIDFKKVIPVKRKKTFRRIQMMT